MPAIAGNLSDAKESCRLLKSVYTLSHRSKRASRGSGRVVSIVNFRHERLSPTTFERETRFSLWLALTRELHSHIQIRFSEICRKVPLLEAPRAQT
jgi:hypothetical protein